MTYTEYTVRVYEGKTEWHNKDGKRHRLDGPAIECATGTKEWWVDGKLHRLDGPAVEWANGSKEWFVDGKYMTEQEFNKHVVLMNQSCEGKVVEINGKNYKLIEV